MFQYSLEPLLPYNSKVVSVIEININFVIRLGCTKGQASKSNIQGYKTLHSQKKGKKQQSYSITRKTHSYLSAQNIEQWMAKHKRWLCNLKNGMWYGVLESQIKNKLKRIDGWYNKSNRWRLIPDGKKQLEMIINHECNKWNKLMLCYLKKPGTLQL